MEQTITVAFSGSPEITEKDGRKTISGYGTVWYNPADPGTQTERGKYLVRFARHSLDESLLSGANIISRYNHCPEYELGDTESHVLKLSTDDKGLRYSLDYDPLDPDHQKVNRKIEKKTVKGSSVEVKTKASDIRIFTENGRDVMEIQRAELREVGPVNRPAFKATSALVCSDEDSETLDRYYADWKKDHDLMERFITLTK